MKKEIIILYVMDALRADHLGCYGYDKPTSPNIDQLAESGVLCENIFAQSTETKSSASTIFTSTYLSVHNTSAHPDILPGGLTTLAEALQGNGFVTAAFNTNVRLGAEYGFDRGFNHHLDLQNRKEFDNVTTLPCSRLINKELFDWLQQVENDKIFVMVWSMDTHLPWFPPKEFAAKFTGDAGQTAPGTMESIIRAKKDSDFEHLESLYDAEIAYNDHHIGELIKQLQELNLWEETTFILTADHGEMFREHGHFMFHGGAPYQEVIHVPLIIKAPGLTAGREKKFAGLVDLMPTILGMSKTPAPETAQGRNLFAAPDSGYVFSESRQSDFKNCLAVFDANWKLIQSEIFNNPIKSKLLNKRAPGKEPGQTAHPLGIKDLHRGISPFLLRKARLQNFKNEFLGVAPTFDVNLFRWLKKTWQHFFGEVRLELYNRREDPFEKRNVICEDSQPARELSARLAEFVGTNRKFGEKLQLDQEHLALDADLAERLRHLGYL